MPNTIQVEHSRLVHKVDRAIVSLHKPGFNYLSQLKGNSGEKGFVVVPHGSNEILILSRHTQGKLEGRIILPSDHGTLRCFVVTDKHVAVATTTHLLVYTHPTHLPHPQPPTLACADPLPTPSYPVNLVYLHGDDETVHLIMHTADQHVYLFNVSPISPSSPNPSPAKHALTHEARVHFLLQDVCTVITDARGMHYIHRNHTHNTAATNSEYVYVFASVHYVLYKLGGQTHYPTPSSTPVLSGEQQGGLSVVGMYTVQRGEDSGEVAVITLPAHLRDNLHSEVTKLSRAVHFSEEKGPGGGSKGFKHALPGTSLQEALHVPDTRLDGSVHITPTNPSGKSGMILDLSDPSHHPSPSESSRSASVSSHTGYGVHSFPYPSHTREHVVSPIPLSPSSALAPLPSASFFVDYVIACVETPAHPPLVVLASQQTAAEVFVSELDGSSQPVSLSLPYAQSHVIVGVHLAPAHNAHTNGHSYYTLSLLVGRKERDAAGVVNVLSTARECSDLELWEHSLVLKHTQPQPQKTETGAVPPPPASAAPVAGLDPSTQLLLTALRSFEVSMGERMRGLEGLVQTQAAQIENLTKRLDEVKKT